MVVTAILLSLVVVIAVIDLIAGIVVIAKSFFCFIFVYWTPCGEAAYHCEKLL